MMKDVLCSMLKPKSAEWGFKHQSGTSIIIGRPIRV